MLVSVNNLCGCRQIIHDQMDSESSEIRFVNSAEAFCVRSCLHNTYFSRGTQSQRVGRPEATGQASLHLEICLRHVNGIRRILNHRAVQHFSKVLRSIDNFIRFTERERVVVVW